MRSSQSSPPRSSHPRKRRSCGWSRRPGRRSRMSPVSRASRSTSSRQRQARIGVVSKTTIVESGAVHVGAADRAVRRQRGGVEGRRARTGAGLLAALSREPARPGRTPRRKRLRHEVSALKGKKVALVGGLLVRRQIENAARHSCDQKRGRQPEAAARQQGGLHAHGRSRRPVSSSTITRRRRKELSSVRSRSSRVRSISPFGSRGRTPTRSSAASTRSSRGMIADRTYHRLLHVDWIVADVDGDGIPEYVPASDQARRGPATARVYARDNCAVQPPSSATTSAGTRTTRGPICPIATRSQTTRGRIRRSRR